MAVSTYGNERCTVRNTDRDIQLPTSTANLRRSILLRDGDEFISDAGRWQIRWDDEAGTLSHSISHSMRPPAIPPPESDLDPQDHEPIAAALDSSSAAPANVESPLPISTPTPNGHENTSNKSNASKVTKPSMQEIEGNGTASETESESDDLDATVELMHQVARPKELHTSSDETPSKPAKYIQQPDALSDDKENRSQATCHDNETDIGDTIVVDVRQNTKAAAFPTLANVKTSHPSQLTSTNASSADSLAKTMERKRKVEQEAGQRAREKKRRIAAPVTNQEVVGEGNRNQKVTRREDSRARDNTEEVIKEQHEPKTHENRIRPRKWSSTTPSTPALASSAKLDLETPTRSAETRSTKRRSLASAVTSDGYDGPMPPKVYFASNTTVDEKKGIMKTFQELGGVKVTTINAANIFCVKDNELVKSSSLLQAILHGMHIVNEGWLIAVHRSRALIDPAQFVPSDPDHELEWSFEISSAVRRGREGFPRLLEGITVWLTVRLKHSLTNKIVRDLSNVASGLGAANIKHGIPKTRVQPDRMTDLVIGIEEDPQAAEVGRLGHKLYEKEILTMAVLRGMLELDSADFKVKGLVKEEDDE